MHTHKTRICLTTPLDRQRASNHAETARSNSHMFELGIVERGRALALVHRKKRELAGSETTNTVQDGVDEGCGDVNSGKAVKEARARRDR